jgi:hypothetical protein
MERNMNDETVRNAFAKLADAVRPFFDEYPRDDDARNVLRILTPAPSRLPEMFAILKQSTEALLKKLADNPILDEHRRCIEAAWEEVLRGVPLR